jgi:hypothetical protein
VPEFFIRLGFFLSEASRSFFDHRLNPSPMVSPFIIFIRGFGRNLPRLLASVLLTTVLQSTASAQTATAPYIITQPVSQTVGAGTVKVTFSCAVGGNPTPTLQWYGNGVPIPGFTQSTCEFDYVSAGLAITLTVVATNSLGTVTSAPATFTVTSDPPIQHIVTQPVDAYVSVGQTASFYAASVFDLSTQIQWQVKTPSGDWQDINSAINPYARAYNFQVSNVTGDMDGYQYRMVVFNSVSRDVSNPATLHVSGGSYLGAYFGTFDTGGGYWALYNYGSTAKFLAFLPDRKSAIVTQLTVSPYGALAGSDTELIAGGAAGASFSLSGQIAAGSTPGSRLVTGQLSGIGRSFSGVFKAGNGSATPISGDFYTAQAINGDQGKVYSVIGYGGDLLSAIVTPTMVDGLSGTVTNLDGNSATFTGTTVGGSTFALTSNIPNHTVSINLTPPSAGAQAVRVKATATSSGSRTITFFGLGDSTPSTSRLVNLSVRASAGTGDQTLIAGFVISGPSAKPLLIRGIGPTLASYGVAGQMTNPQLKLYSSSGSLLNSNDDWGGSASLQSLFQSLGAFSLDPSSQDAALSVTLSGAPYSAQVTSTNGQTGVALVEVYDADANRDTRLVNVSARNNVGTGANALIAGFVITGNAPVQLLIRGIGPALSGYGVGGVLADPKLQIFDNNGQLIVENDDWGGSADLTAAATQVGAFSLNNPASKDAALLVTLLPGTYSAQVSGQGGTTGVALIEIYEVPPQPESNGS